MVILYIIISVSNGNTIILLYYYIIPLFLSIFFHPPLMFTENKELLINIVQEGKMRAELDELFSKVLQSDVYAGMELNMNQSPIKLTLKVFNPAQTVGESQFRLYQIQSMVAQRLNVSTSSVEVVFERIADKGLEPAYHAEQLRQAFVEVRPYKRTVNSVIRSARAAGAQGISVRISGKLKGQRAKSIKFIDGLLIQAGQPAKDYIKKAKTYAECKQGIIGIQIALMLPYDPEGVRGSSTILADKITVLPSKSL
ncbi:hypothetical protein NUSPORA_01514 [Nucleospora cyclopteri]